MYFVVLADTFLDFIKRGATEPEDDEPDPLLTAVQTNTSFNGIDQNTFIFVSLLSFFCVSVHDKH